MSTGNGADREPLTRDRICEVALEAIDEAGLECVSMRTLADALGVRASSLYYHFSCKDELLTGVAEFLYRRLGRPPEEGEWHDQVKGTFVQLHDFIQDHPNAAPLLLRDLAYSPVAKKRAGVLLRLLGRAGLDPEASTILISNLVALLVGHSLLEVWVDQGGTPGVVDEADDGPGGAAPRLWVRKVLDTGGQGARLAGAAEMNQLSADRGSAAVSVLVDQALEGRTNAGFLAGLDALIKGFPPTRAANRRHRASG